MIAAVIPARNEADCIAEAVSALRAQGAEVLVIANGCDDDTAARAALAGAAVEEVDALPGGVGEARRLGCASALRRWPRARALVSTDADCTVGAGTLPVVEEALRRADAVMGRVVDEPEGFAALPGTVRRLRRLENRRDALLAEIGGRANPLLHDPLPRHARASGALMAFRPAAYRASGGFAPLRCNEDREMGRRMGAMGFRLAHPWRATVIASCRAEGRAPMGMADAIARHGTGDPSDTIARIAAQVARLERLVSALRGGASLDRLDLSETLHGADGLRAAG